MCVQNTCITHRGEEILCLCEKYKTDHDNHEWRRGSIENNNFLCFNDCLGEEFVRGALNTSLKFHTRKIEQYRLRISPNMVLLLSHYWKLDTESYIDDNFLRTVVYSSDFLRHEIKIDKQLVNAQLAIQYIILQQ